MFVDIVPWLVVVGLYVFFAWLALYSLRAIWRWINRY